MKENLKLSGRVRIDHYKADGSVETEEFDNLVVTAGKALVASLLRGDAVADVGYLAVGTGATAPDVGDTTLQTEIYREACAAGGSANSVQFQTTLVAGEGTGALTEAGLFNAASAGTMLSRVVFAVKNKEAGEAMTITWTVTVN